MPTAPPGPRIPGVSQENRRRGAGPSQSAARHRHAARHHRLKLGRGRASKKERRLSAAIKKLGEAMRVAERNGEHPVALAAVHLMLLTGFRISEAQGLQRDWLHADQGYLGER